ncbi:MAG: RteC domain-containing protein [Niabella sp.]
MEEFYNEILNKLETAINGLEIEVENSLRRIEAIIPVVMQSLSELKAYVLKTGFSNEEEEIRFFKYQKPVIVAKLIYYNAVYKIEAKKPHGRKEVLENYFNSKLSDLKTYFDENISFYSYYRTESTHLDETYFLRGRHNIKLGLDTFYFETDHNFNTSHDYKVAKIIANDLIEEYLENQLFKTAVNDIPTNQTRLIWTGTKTALTELIYALHSQGVFNNGSVDIKPIATVFERAFNVDLGEFYHTYLEIKYRKINRTKFLDELKENLIKRMDEQDGI